MLSLLPGWSVYNREWGSYSPGKLISIPKYYTQPSTRKKERYFEECNISIYCHSLLLRKLPETVLHKTKTQPPGPGYPAASSQRSPMKTVKMNPGATQTTEARAAWPQRVELGNSRLQDSAEARVH